MLTSPMNTVQEPLTPVIPPPCVVQNSAKPNRADLPSNKDNNNSNPSSTASDTNELPERCQFDHPIRMVVPSAGESHLQDELSPVNKVQRERGTSPELRGDHGFIDTNPLPPRCQLLYSDGRQARLARPDLHPSRCPSPAASAAQLVPDPAPGAHSPG